MLNIHLPSQASEKWLEHFARFGMISKGVVYCLMGILSILAALGLQREKADKTQAIKVIYEQPFGKVLLILIAFGLLGYVTWRTFQAVKDIEHKGNGVNGVFKRIGYAGSALLYLALGIYAVKLVIERPGGNGDSRQFIVSKILEYPGGEWFVGIASLVLIGVGIHHMYKAVTGKFMEKVQLIDPVYRDLFRNIGAAGYISRGIVLCIIGYFLLHAAINSNPQEAHGTREAFDFLEHTFGNILMSIVALGLAGYGTFMFVRAKYQLVNFQS